MSSRSEVWHYFVRLDFQEAQCKICKAILQNKGSTSSLWGHLRARHVNTKSTSKQDQPEADKYSETDNRDREPLSSLTANADTSDIKIEEEVYIDDKPWSMATNLESIEDPSQESLSDKCTTRSSIEPQQIKISDVSSKAYDVQSYLIQRLHEAERRNEEVDEDGNFCRMVESKLKKLAPKKSAEVKIKILQILFEAEFGNSRA